MREKKKRKNSIWALATIITILNIFFLVVSLVALFYVSQAFVVIGDNSFTEYVASKIPLGLNTTLENGILTVGDNQISIFELLTLGLSFITTIVVVNFIGNSLCLISGILGLRYYSTQSKYKILFGWGFAGIVGSILSVRLISFILFIVYTVKVHTYRFEDEDIKMVAKHAA